MYIYLGLYLFFAVNTNNLLKTNVVGQGEISEWIKNSPAKSDYPGAGAVMLFEKQVFEVNPDNTSSLCCELVIKIFDDRGKAEYGDIKIRYNADTQKFKLLKACTHTADGKTIQPESLAITDLSAPEVLYAGAYTNARVKIVSFPGLGPDAIIEYKYKIENKKDKYFFGEVLFSGREPVLKKEFKIITPKNVKFKYSINDNINHAIDTLGDKIEYLWSVENIAPINREPYMPALTEIVPRLVYSSFDSWEELAKWLGAPFYKNMVLNKRMGDELKVLTKNKSPEEITRICFLKVLAECRNIRLPVGFAGYAPNKADKVYYNKYGDPRDKVVLLCSLLRGSGINAYPVFINTSGTTILEDIPSPTMFNWVIVAVEHQAGWFLLDPMATAVDMGCLPAEEQGVEGLIVLEKSHFFKKTLIMPSAKNLSVSTLHLKLSKDGNLAGDIFTELGGIYSYNARRELQDKTPKELDMWLEGNVSRFGTGTKIISHFLSDVNDVAAPVELNVSFETSKFSNIEGKTMQFFIPFNPLAFVDIASYIGVTDRKYDLRMLTSRTIEEHVDIELPDEFKIDRLPENVELENKMGSISISASLRNNKVLYNSLLELKEAYIPVADYGDFNALVTEFLKSQSRLITLLKSSASKAK